MARMEAIGLGAKEISKTDPAAVRNIVGRLLWMIRDESGGSAGAYLNTW